MASSYMMAGEKCRRRHHPHHHQMSPKNNRKKPGFSNPAPQAASFGQDQPHPGGSLPKCVCAPATHAGSFKCRLHRVNAHGRSVPSAPAPRDPTSSTRAVQAR